MGGRAIINCVIGDLAGRVQWTKDGLTLGYFRELPGFGRYAVLGTDESGVFNLQINNATLGDEAVYECQVGPNGTNKPIRASAKLNVLCKFIISILHSVVCLLSIEQQI